MKIFLQLFIGIILLQLSFDARSACTTPPSISSATHTNITSTTATLGGDVTGDGSRSCTISEIGVQWSTTSGSGYIDIPDAGTSTGVFTVAVTGLPAGTRIYYRAYATNEFGTGYTTERSFYTLATEPAQHAASLTATALNANEIQLQFPAASSISNAVGYIILRRQGSVPTLANLNDGSAPTGATYYLATLNNTTDAQYTVSGLSPNTSYYFAIIPYNRSGNDATYNYLTTPGFPTANASTEANVAISVITGGLAGTTVNGGASNEALIGFSLNASGPVTFQSVLINLSSTTSDKFSNFRLCESSNTTFDNIMTDPPLTSGVTIIPSASQISITLSEALLATPTRNFFLVADVDVTVNASTPSVAFSYDEMDFTFSPNNISGTVLETRTYDFADVTDPVLISTNPSDGATTVDISTNKLILTFNENVDNITTAASANAHRVIIYEDAVTDVAVLTVDRVNVVASGTTTAEINIPGGTLGINKNYYVLIGNALIEDVPAGNDWGGISDPTIWNFTTSGVNINNVTSNICSGSFQSIGDIVISEVGNADFNTSGTIFLNFANADFGYDISGVTVSAGPAGNTDITSIQLNPKTLTRLTLNYTLDSTNNKTDVITISGLKVYASAPGSTTIIKGGGTASWDANASLTFATINVGTTVPASPQLETAPVQDLLYCANENISAVTVSVVNNGGTFTWYNNASLSVPVATGFQVSVQGELGINASVVETVKRYVVRIDGCQSAPLEVTFVVAPIPVADAGPATATICSGSPITLGGSPTLIGPSVTGTYQYFWSTNSPAGFTNMGPNPTVSPMNDRDTTFNYTVKIVDANNCASDITDINATIAVAVDSTTETIIYNSPLSTSFTLNTDPIELKATPSINSSYSGNGVYLSGGKYYFDPDLAGTAGSGSPHAITYTTNLTNGCSKTEVRNFAVSNSSGSIVNLANSYCQNETAKPVDVLSLGPDWSNNLAADNAYYSANYGYTYEFYDFQTYMGTDIPGTGVSGAIGSQYIDPVILQPYPTGNGLYAYVGMRVRKKTTVLLVDTYESPIFWSVQYVSIYPIPALKVSGLRNGQIVCDVDETYILEANFETGTYEISRDNINYFSGPTLGIVDNPVNSGKAIFNPHDAFISSGFGVPPASGITAFYIRYTYIVPNTSGSNSSACESALTLQFEISPNPVVAWDPFASTEFCFEAPNFTVSTNPRNGIAITGYGIFDNSNGTAFFNPDEGLKAKAFGTNSPPYTDYNTPEDIIIAATRTDGNGCKTTINQTVQVRPLFPASFTESDLDVCYEDGTQNIVGGQPNGNYILSHPDLTVNFAQTTINGFNLRTYFNDAVANGADSTISQRFNLTFNTSDPGLGCSNSITKTFTINPPIPMDIGGMTSGMIVCGNGTPFELTGNQPSAGAFEISTSSGSGFVSNALGLNNTTSGKATYTPSGAGVPAGNPQKSLYIRYSFQGAGCVGSARTTEELIINPQPAISFASSIPAANTQYCFEQGSSPTTVNLTTNQISNVTLSGYGITDNGGGNATFNPTSAYQQSSLADNLNPLTDQTIRNIVVTARRTDAYSCANTTTVAYTVNPLPTATFAPAKIEYCYEDNVETISGGQTNVSYQFFYKNTNTPANYSPPEIFQPTTIFDPKQFFDDAVSKGANALATLQFDVIYTAINSATGCTNEKAPVTFTVSPRIPVEIAGIDEGDIFCSNVTDKELVFNPPNGTFRIDGITEPLNNGKYLFDPLISGPANGTDYTFTYTVITGNNCTNTQEKTIKVLPSPKAIFSVDPRCDTALIAYDANPSTNLASALYTWTLSDVVKTGRNVEHRFPGVSTYSVHLKVEHPAYLNNPELVCSDSLRLDQIIGPYPDIDFEFFNVCEEDETNFEVVTNIPISRVSWDFGDGEITGLGILSGAITGSAITSGTYQKPIHKYGGANDQIVVKVLGKTSDNFGGCETSFERAISILKTWVPTATGLSYDMSKIDNGKGYWVIEDKKGNTSWEFNTATKLNINTNEMAWVTGPALPYNADDISYVNSPCFDLSGFTRPVLSIKHWTDTEPSDGAVLQYSIDGGENWERLGDVASGLEWYNRLTISANPGEQTDLSSGWSVASQPDWAVGKHTLDVIPGTRNQVRFRVAFSSFNNRENRDGFAFNNLVIEERNRTILVENFTNLSDTDNNNAYKNFKTINGNFNSNELVKLQYHHASVQSSSAPTDELNEDNPVDQNARAAFYGVTEPVRAFIDGGFGQASTNFTFLSSSLIDTYFSLRSLVSSPVDISIDFKAEPSDKLNVKATIQANNTIGETDQYNVFIAIAEQDILGQVYVLRKFLPDASGTPLTVLSETDPPQEVIASYDMRHITRLPNGDFAPVAVVVFVQNLETKDVLQTVMRQDATPSSNIVTGIETSPENYIRLYPNPADHALNIILPAPIKMETPVKVFDTFGKQVFAGVFKIGEQIKTLETKTLSAGVYLVQLSTPDGLVRKKAMVMHE